MDLDLLKRAGLDRYDLNARLRPALFVLLPALALVTFWLPAARTFMGSIVTLLSACGLTYLLAQVARRSGRAMERALGDRAGRRHSALLLTHADPTIAAPTKARYHAYLRASGGLELSTPQEEAQDASLAYDRVYRPQIVRHRSEAYAAKAAGGSCAARTVAGGRNPCRSISHVSL